MVSKMNDMATHRIPDGFLPIPIHETPPTTPLRVCALVRRVPDPAAGYFVLLRDLPDAMVYLGCVTDAAGRLREWIEIWVQNVDGLESSLPALRESFSNRTIDQRWAEQAETLAALDPAGALRAGWEKQHPLPCLLDPGAGLPVQPGDDQGGRWELCENDQALAAAGLPRYGESLYRYLWQPKSPSRLVPATAGSPTNEKTLSLSEAAGPAAGFLPLNVQGGLLMVNSFSPFSFEEYADLLGGKPWKGLEQGKKHLAFDGPYAGLEDWSNIQQSGLHLFLGAKGRAGRFTETLHLKLQLITDMVRTVRMVTERHQLPFLNLAADSFRVRLQPVGARLPVFWTAQLTLARTGDAYALPIEDTEARYFIRSRPESASIYLPEGLGVPLQGTGSVRLRQVQPVENGRTTVEGTLVLQERQDFSKHDLFWIRLPLPTGRVDLYGHLYSAEGLARGEVRFHTVPQALPEGVSKALKAAEGAAFPRSPFEVVPLLSSPCDLYSLGVLAARALLVNEGNTLPVALDELLSLARQAAEADPALPLGQRVRALLEKDERFLAALGPQRLLRDAADPKEAMTFLPAELWCDTLAALSRFFPGVGPDSACKDFGDVPALALETAFNQPLADLEKLLVRSRSLIVIDWNQNREINAVIGNYLAGAKPK
jgi:hypothetical protein